MKCATLFIKVQVTSHQPTGRLTDSCRMVDKELVPHISL